MAVQYTVHKDIVQLTEMWEEMKGPEHIAWQAPMEKKKRRSSYSHLRRINSKKGAASKTEAELNSVVSFDIGRNWLKFRRMRQRFPIFPILLFLSIYLAMAASSLWNGSLVVWHQFSMIVGCWIRSQRGTVSQRKESVGFSRVLSYMYTTQSSYFGMRKNTRVTC